MIAEFKVATPVVTNGINMLPNEINILHSVSHPYLINLEGVINTTNFHYILLEFAEGTQLFVKIIYQTKLNKDNTMLDFY